VQLLVTPTASSTPPTQAGLPQIADASTTRDLLLEFIDAGATHLVLAAVGSGLDRPVRWLADEIVEPVLQRLAHGQPAVSA
jgi:hypothetical protein